MCPNCGKPMILVRSVPKIGALPELRTYNCRSCGETVTEGDKPVQMRDGDDRAGRRLTLTPNCCYLRCAADGERGLGLAPILALLLACTLASAALFQPALMGPPRTAADKT
jgi:hypothetical protein